jgi:hypothetical protein
MKYKIFNIIFLLLILLFFQVNYVLAVGADLYNRLYDVADYADYAVENSNPEDQNIAIYVGKIISYVLAVLGVIFLTLLVYAGFVWMTARGDSEQITRAKDIMVNVVIGLIIILMSYAFTYYIVSNLAKTTITGVGGTP